MAVIYFPIFQGIHILVFNFPEFFVKSVTLVVFTNRRYSFESLWFHDCL